MNDNFEILNNNNENNLLFNLKNKYNNLIDNDKYYTINSYDIYKIEKDNKLICRIHGNLNFFSLLNGISNDYKSFKDFFIKTNINEKNIYNSFNFYILKPSNLSEYNKYDDDSYLIKYEIIANNNNIELLDCSYQVDIYNHKTYLLILNIDIDLTDIYDYYNLPITDLYLYAEYKTVNNEKMYFNKWNSNGNIQNIEFNNNNNILNIGDILINNNNYINDIYSYNFNLYNKSLKYKQIFNIETPIILNDKYITYSINYDVYIECKLSINNHNNYNQMFTVFYYSLDDGNNWIKYKEIKPNHNLIIDNYYLGIDRFTLNLNIIDVNIDKILFKFDVIGSVLGAKGKAYITINSISNYNNINGFVDCKNKYNYININNNNNVSHLLECLEVQNNNKLSDFSIKFFTKYQNNIVYNKFKHINNNSIKWYYYPFIPIKIGNLSESLYKVNSDSSIYDNIIDIPKYAYNNGNNTYIWRNLIIDEESNLQSNNKKYIPFINGRRYYFFQDKISIIPNMNDEFTNNLFNDIYYDDIVKKTTKPKNNINDIANPC